MRALFSTLRNHLFPPSLPVKSSEELRAEFALRYRNFRSLLTANNNALQAMAELEKLYYSGESYRMAVIRSKITAILVNVYKMIRNLREMSGGRYAELERKFEGISKQLGTIVDSIPRHKDGPLILPLHDVSRAQREQVGEKMANLGEVAGLGDIRVPHGFVVTATATRRFLSSTLINEINRRLQSLDPDNLNDLSPVCKELQQMIIDSPLPPELEELLMIHYERLERAVHPGCLVALRSSGLGEDTAGVSFAGLYRTILDVDKDTFVSAYKEVIAGKYGARAIAYRRKRGYRHEDIEMCVGCLTMIDSAISGVTYSRDPKRPEQDLISVNAVSGLGRGVVDGVADTDLFLIERRPPYRLESCELRQQASKLNNGTALQILTEPQLKNLADTALRLERYFGSPQDIEWSFDQQGLLYILQSRPMLRNNLRSEQNISSKPINLLPLLSGGISASGGIAFGAVHHAITENAQNSFSDGSVLVIEHPVPDWAPLVSRASAVIAETGTEAGHLATIAREFGIPALFGLPGAITKLTDGQLITVDSSSTSIYAGRIDELLTRKTVRRDLMAGSPVQRIVSEALEHITPLNLSDPASMHFKASMCETLHDITRFSHEKSVSEMFNFGGSTRFAQGSAKRLVGDAPMEWWVIDLADGFKPEIADDARTIRIEEIVSQPMLAIWQGISAFPWQGPPPISARGFGSIIFQSAIRPDLDPAVASKLTTKNYFLISANFCNLSVRLGYHYAMIESYLSDLLTESYVTFRFKGGAADMRRKAVRAELLAEVLKEYGFSVELRSDALLARVKKKPIDYLSRRLQILGYITLHARQIDMVMTNPQALARYREKFYKDINEMLAKKPSQTQG
ncbi:PEP/pyruvate-binding domain-containing protein [Desulfosediminicola flagellatus]|uniref:PEP/pyruvate-binding domain-containing protein n=1 Tax=Desulfosediminicola flagellatus TaxID=2569541 RepID=UPI0010ABAC36|nr:PEP/pyruvate-binding domain-containing protein [Desulfosediminicola flagellatus]